MSSIAEDCLPEIASPIALLYLARKAEGRKAFETFLDSYAAHPAGVEHDLIVVLKGFEERAEVEAAKALFSPFAKYFVVLPDEGFDVDAYCAAARRIQNEYICCLNTFSCVLADAWLGKLYAQAALPEVGIAGAMGSYESNQDSLIFFQKVVWFSTHGTLSDKQRDLFSRYFDFVLNCMCPSAPVPKVKKRGLRGAWQRVRRQLFQERTYQAWWRSTKAKVGLFAELCNFPPFPNAHIRTNAFMMRRQLLVEVAGKPSANKLDVSRIESGPESLTRQLRRRGLKARIVGQDAIGYDVEDWFRSRTFRLGSQGNLLVADNRTRDYENASPGWRVTHAWLSWGEQAVQLPPSFPRLGMRFSGRWGLQK